MRMAAGLAIAALLLGCARPDTDLTRPLLSFSPDLAEGFQALPRVRSDTAQARAINAMLDRVDRVDRENRTLCLEARGDNDNVEWGRSVDAPMTGPRFVSVLITRGHYCGGAHPDWEQSALVLDLETGRMIDWRAFLPADLVEKMQDQGADEWVRPAYLTSPALKAWFAGLALDGVSPEVRQECAGLYGDDGVGSWGLEARPDAKAGGLTLQTAGLAHAETGCQMDVTMPVDELRRRGVHPDLVAAIETAHRAGLWREAPPSPETIP